MSNDILNEKICIKIFALRHVKVKCSYQGDNIVIYKPLYLTLNWIVSKLMKHDRAMFYHSYLQNSCELLGPPF